MFYLHLKMVHEVRGDGALLDVALSCQGKRRLGRAAPAYNPRVYSLLLKGMVHSFGSLLL